MCAEFRTDSPSNCADANSQLTLRERLVLSALIVGVTLWIRVAEGIPELRRA
jgi:hypothetical protein